MKQNFKIGVLGGGQLGKMLALAAQNWDLHIWCLDQSKDFPAGTVCHNLVEGDFKNYQDVLDFGRQVDLLTIEIEHVNLEALETLEKEGLTIHPSPAALKTIKDKGMQKLFYQKHNLPTAPFQLLEDEKAILKAIQEGTITFPFVQKSRGGGYDGKGVAIIRDETDLDKLLPGPALIETLADIEKEIAVVVCRNEKGEIATFNPVEMEFHPTANLVEFLICPANISQKIAEKCDSIARSIIEKMDVCGLLAVELFLNKNGEIWVNEVAPRPHNSGHHTIDSCTTSQFQQHLRGILNMPLGSTQILSPAVMVNLLGTDGYTGPAVYPGFEYCMALSGAKFHLYGKTVTKPFRKMGHATILDDDIESAKEKGRFIMENFKIITQ